ncbi:hypothetical protein ACHAXR_008097, partial [Thalassiosira sp. AJA248-18]
GILASTPKPTLRSAADLRLSHSFSDTAHWVIPGVLMQGKRPQVEQISKILRLTNCRTFACLQAECLPEKGSILLDDGGVQDWKCDPMNSPAYCDEVQAITNEIGGPSPVFLHYGIRDMSTVERFDGLLRVVSELANRIRSGEKIYLHCWGGKGRAGLVAACLLMELYRDIDADVALEYIQTFCQLRNMEGDSVQYTSPETEKQKEQVREYFERLPAC